MWIFDYRDFSVKKVVQVADDYEINIDDETNTTSTVKVVEETNAKSGDLVAIKRNGSIVYWGIIDNE